MNRALFAVSLLVAASSLLGCGGGDAEPECEIADECPAGENACLLPTCVEGMCGTAPVASGTQLTAQTTGDCQRVVCDGAGGTQSVADDADIVADTNACTVDVCAAGAPSHAPEALHVSCASPVPGTFCDGAGACVECTITTDCTGDDVCRSGQCVAPTCTDLEQNGTETDQDCGGGCPACANTKTCAGHADCTSGLCIDSVCTTSAPIAFVGSDTGHDRFFNVALDTSGRIYAVGVRASSVASDADYATMVVRFTPRGALDTTFADEGVFVHNLVVGANGELARGIAIQADGKIVIGATVEHEGSADARDRDIAFLRLLTTGELDPDFGVAGVRILNPSDGSLFGVSYLADSLWHIAIGPEETIYGTGSTRVLDSTDFFVVRLTSTGAPDMTFDTDGLRIVDASESNASARALTVLADGSVVAAGYSTFDGVTNPVAFKLTSGGAPSMGFGMSGVFTENVLAAATDAHAIGQQGTAFILAGTGRVDSTTESLDWLVYRLKADGTRDMMFGTEGVTRLDFSGFQDNARQSLVLGDGRIVVVGTARPTSSDADGAVALLGEDGAPSTAFSATGTRTIDLGGTADVLWGVAAPTSAQYVVAAGFKGVGPGGGLNDDAMIVIVPLP